MNFGKGFALGTLLCCAAFSAAADSGEDSQNLVKYLKALGGYLGYDLTQDPTADGQTVSAELLSVSTTQLAENYIYNTFFGALPVTSMTDALIVPASFAGAKIINAMANATFKLQKYQDPSSGDQGKVSVSTLIDQETYQADPVSQAVLNILGTPDYTYCMDFDQTSWQSDCKLLYQNKVTFNVLGSIPKPTDFFTYDYNKQLINQLNSNSLMGPLQYTTENTSSNTGSPTPNSTNPGLTAQNQVQEAYNFIRYATAAVIPGSLPPLKGYNSLYQMATAENASGGDSASDAVANLKKMQAQNTLSSYFANLRVFAAQSSVGIGNLYFLLSKRLPQKLGENNSTVTSQAMSEFNMASWRLFKADLRADKQWVNQLNKASSATIEKEIATLLAEINYQLYLDRQIQERILLTNSIMLIQNSRAGQPAANFGSANSPE